MPSPEEALRAYRTNDRRLVACTAIMFAFVVVLCTADRYLPDWYFTVCAAVPLTVGVLALVFSTWRRSRFAAAVEALHAVGVARLSDPRPVESRVRWWHLDTVLLAMTVAFVAVTAYRDPAPPAGPIVGGVVLAAVMALGVLLRPPVPRLPGTLVRVSADGVHVPAWRLTVPWPDVAAIWPIPHERAQSLGLALLLADPKATVAGSGLGRLGRWRLRKEFTGVDQNCLFLPETWFRTPLEDALQAAHAFKRASVEGR
jgi:hypothetical protein